MGVTGADIFLLFCQFIVVDIASDLALFTRYFWFTMEKEKFLLFWFSMPFSLHLQRKSWWKKLLASIQRISQMVLGKQLWPLLLTWFNFNPSMDK